MSNKKDIRCVGNMQEGGKGFIWGNFDESQGQPNTTEKRFLQGYFSLE